MVSVAWVPSLMACEGVMSNRVQAMVDKEAEGKTQEIISNNCPQGHIPSDPLLQSLQKFSQSSTRQGQSCLHLSLWRTLPFQSIKGPRDRGDAMRLLSSGVRRGGETRIQLSIIVWGSLTTAPWLQVSMATVWNKPSFFYYYYFYFLAAPTHSSQYNSLPLPFKKCVWCVSCVYDVCMCMLVHTYVCMCVVQTHAYAFETREGCMVSFSATFNNICN